MSKSMNMLRTRRRDNNVKPNRRDTRVRRLDRKSSRGMIYENEELRLRTININAEIERGQYDIKKLKRENEMLKKEIWCLRDEYDKLDKLLKEKEYEFSSSSTTCSTSDSESCSTCSEESEEVETSQNLQNVQKTNMKNLHSEFDHLSVVPEENSTENSDKNSIRENVIQPDQTYEKSNTQPKNFFSPLNMNNDQFYSEKVVPTNAGNFYLPPKTEPTIGKTTSDLIVKTDNHGFDGTPSRSTFSNGGNLEELLNDIETISQDILKITNDQVGENGTQKPFKSELNVVLMPNPMPLLGFDKYRNLQNSFESLGEKPEIEATNCDPTNPFIDKNTDFFNTRYNPENFEKGSKTNLLELTSSDLISSENEENLKFQTSKTDNPDEKKSPKESFRRKVSIHFKGKKDKKNSIFSHQKTPSMDSQKSPDKKKSEEKKRKSVSVSPDRKHVHVKDEKRHRKHRKGRRGTLTSVDRPHRERSFSVCTDRSLAPFDEGHSDRERTNSLSSCETVKTRKMSNISNIPLNGKVPWCACWGNGCI